MHSRIASALIVALGLGAATAPAAASEFRVVTDRNEFVSLVDGRELRRFGIRLTVTPDGEIGGSGFGQTVFGAWEWNGNFFCRDLGYGSTDLGHNCQLVAVRDGTIRFVADQGQGDHADFRLR
ncbi:dihydrodipicolinate reductase [Rhodobaculum claviforme]|uniref:Dihydrodipicolinate reductase n=1 Tax=Rhodobaculum claviforme TaxID=1549854 RepID=A0A934TLF1_9RHOB|nr:dihydrodipicolinate reductase [Rhodobaculum claviforme]MBK5927297.1 dihydrodipicolinate reductase [Rhodobaculum claviforme]